MAELDLERLRERALRLAGTLDQAANGGLSDSDLAGLARGLVPWVREDVVAPLNAHIAKLEARIAELEQRHVLEDCGTWDQDKSYRPGCVVQHQGSRWVCLTATTSRPPGDDWQLWVKRGRDGK